MRARIADCARAVDRVERFGKEHDAEVAELRKVLDQASQLLASNDADIVTRESQVETNIAAMQARRLCGMVIRTAHPVPHSGCITAGPSRTMVMA